MKKRNLNLETDYISDSDELIQTEFDFMSDDELDKQFEYLMSKFF